MMSAETENARNRPCLAADDCGRDATVPTRDTAEDHGNSVAASYTPTQIDRAKSVLARAEAWRRDNPQAWSFVVDLALAWTEGGRLVSGRALVEAVRKRDFVDVRGNPTRINNDYAAVFTRWLIIAHPHMAAQIERRTTIFDSLTMGCSHTGGAS